ncbi:MAG: ABC transporter permease [Acidobacteria bacterium]|nr:ABC transporter permease [Acidobacteriota bacterium]
MQKAENRVYLKPFEKIGKAIFKTAELTGMISLFIAKTLRWAFHWPLEGKLIFKQMEEIGVRSIPVVFITTGFTGMVFALQSYAGFKQFTAESLVGAAVALAIVRELSPVLTGLMVAGRAGSAMAAEIGTMKVTEQIDALSTMAVEPIQYLIVPRMIASITMLPILTMVGNFFGIFGGYLVSVELMGLNPSVYWESSYKWLVMNDFIAAMIKASCFGFIISVISCYYGFNSEGGAEGVGQATTRSVVIACMMILVSDFFLTKALF